MSWSDDMKPPEDYTPARTLAYSKIAYYWVEMSTLGHFDGEDIAFIVDVYYKGTRVDYATFDTEDKAMAFFKDWAEERLPVQIAMEAHGAATPLRVIDAWKFRGAV